MVSGLGFAGLAAAAPLVLTELGGLGEEVDAGFWIGLAGGRTVAVGDGAPGEDADGTSFSAWQEGQRAFLPAAVSAT